MIICLWIIKGLEGLCVHMYMSEWRMFCKFQIMAVFFMYTSVLTDNGLRYIFMLCCSAVMGTALHVKSHVVELCVVEITNVHLCVTVGPVTLAHWLQKLNVAVDLQYSVSHVDVRSRLDHHTATNHAGTRCLIRIMSGLTEFPWGIMDKHWLPFS